jgi:hypothetical protein
MESRRKYLMTSHADKVKYQIHINWNHAYQKSFSVDTHLDGYFEIITRDTDETWEKFIDYQLENDTIDESKYR